MSFHPVLDGASDEGLLLFGQPVRADTPVEGRARGGPESRGEVLSVAVDAPDVGVDDSVPVAAGLDALVPQVIGASGLLTLNSRLELFVR